MFVSLGMFLKCNLSVSLTFILHKAALRLFVVQPVIIIITQLIYTHDMHSQLEQSSAISLTKSLIEND